MARARVRPRVRMRVIFNYSMFNYSTVARVTTRATVRPMVILRGLRPARVRARLFYGI